MFYSIWIWGLSRLDDTSIGNYVQFCIKRLNHLCGIQIYRGVLCVKDLVDSCTRYGIWGRKMLVKYRCLPLFICLRMYSTGQYLMLLQLGSVSYMCSHYCTVSATGLPSALVQWFGSSTFLQGPRLHQLHPEMSPSRAVAWQLWRLTRTFGSMGTRTTMAFSILNRSLD